MAELVKYEQARAALATCHRVDEAKAIRDKAEALRAYGRQVGDCELETWAAEIKLRAMKRLGELSRALDKAKPAGRGGSRVAPGALLKKDALRIAGVPKRTASRCEQIAKVPDEEFEAVVADHKAKGQAVSSKELLNQAARAIRKKKKRERLVKAAEMAAANGDGHDPPRLILGDCLSYLERAKVGTPRLVFADPPYNIGVDYGDGAKADWRPEEEFLAWCGRWMTAVREVLADDGSFWVLINDEYADHFGLLLRRAGFHRRAWLKWYESFGVNCADNFNRTSRHLFYCVKDPKRFVFHPDAVSRPSDRQAKYGDARADPGGKVWDDVWGINPPVPRLTGTCAERLPDFPTQLPLALLRPIVGCASDPGDLIVDPFCGSGTAGVAAFEAGRRFVGIERQKNYHELATLRLKGVRYGVQD